MRPRTTSWSPKRTSSDTATPLATPPRPVEAVPRLNLERYVGEWHEIARLPMSFQRRCAGEATARYSLNDNGTITVLNSCRTASGGSLSAKGVARQPDPFTEPAKLKVRFAPAWLGWLPFVWADYWVIALDDDYQWAIVGEPERKYLWILAREPRMPRDLFDELKAKARRMGFDLAPLIVSPRRAG